MIRSWFRRPPPNIGEHDFIDEQVFDGATIGIH